jgi:16S rRNA (adenine1518-N6/adenine1519-N6)-dimethyltransferase
MPTERQWLQSRGIRPRKSLGQNFLLDPRIPREILRRASWPQDAAVCEIGAGGGSLTAALLASGRRVLAVEVDPELAELLRERFAPEIAGGRLRVHPGDFLELPVDPLESAGPPLWLAGNLPYGITTPILLRCFGLHAVLCGAVFMVQREYAERMLARPGEDAYASLSVWTAAHARGRLLLRVGRSAFWPRPGVESAVVELLFPDPPPYRGNLPRLQRVLRAAFGQRRKTMENALAHGLGLPKAAARELLVGAGCDPSARAERLSLEDFGRIEERFGGERPGGEVGGGE